MAGDDFQDVQRTYGNLAAVRIAQSTEDFVDGCADALALARSRDWLASSDAVIADNSWDRAFEYMTEQVAAVGRKNSRRQPPSSAKPALVGLRPHFDYLIVGAGFAGAVLAERLAVGSNKRVLVIDQRNHVGGNAFDYYDAAGILIHQYGPHIFHTNSADVFTYLSQFTRWRPYEHRVQARVADTLVPLPINRTTLNSLYGLSLRSDSDVVDFLSQRAEPLTEIRTSEDVVVSKVGRELYELFFRGYTRKQWGVDPSALDKSVAARIPSRTTTDDRYFTDRYQFMPLHGYTSMFMRMLSHKRITLALNVSFKDVRKDFLYDHLIYTGPIDAFFDCRYGALPYRSLEFRHITVDTPQFQPTGTVNYPDEAVPYTRITEYKHLTGQSHARTTITYEFPQAEGAPYYPVPCDESQRLYKKYEALKNARPDVTFAGRLASYRYYNMDQVVGQALAIYRRLCQGEAVVSPAANAVR